MRKCAVEACPKPYYAKGYCNMHWQRWKKYGDTSMIKVGGKTHGMSKTPEFRAWQGILNRCYNVKSPKYHLYGARGIQVCDKWKEGFMHFYSDMGPRPSPLHSIDRIDNDGNYEPSNCRWATMKVQQNNRRNNVAKL